MFNVHEQQKNTHDWHRADIVAALHKRGWTVTSLAKAHGLSPSTLRSALEKSYPKSEKIIAEAIGVAPAIIWAERHAKRTYTPILHK
ncbi:helix-turn-helix domain-containing protein [Moraxella bovis]|uniref:helix-turn-helix domain-containing protein n=1 Tax=Moraxella bovis TaxID=476 RepID=UPI002225DEC8|nr:helix-turn-helix domain-containing protein [Moraxella bovis]UYZ81468.1 helix-turn-helix domain-containing protein [Moraxella bovis]UZA05970.1 helix-turn-helix domain-containing protein [Moraxella bovis]UZA11802.1 helix-turn-helix domain-containing protein [Moraxella bovis]